MTRTLALAAALSLSTALPALAQDADGMRQLGAHVHGAAELLVAVNPDGTAVAELSGAAWNFFGFEGAIQTEAQRRTVADARARLTAGGLVTFSERAGCTLTDTVIMGAPEAGEAAHDPDHDGHGHGHDRAHDHDHEHGHDHDESDHDHGHDHAHEHGEHDHDHADHDHGDHDHGAHNDVVVNWTFACDAPERIGHVDASGLFEGFGGLERLEIQYLDTRTATAGQLTPAAPRLGL
ncbi:MAG: DUF2796 domain-containing protein [Oceanicaulis sp.]